MSSLSLNVYSSVSNFLTGVATFVIAKAGYYLSKKKENFHEHD